MFKAKEASLRNIVPLLVVSLAVSAVFYLSRPQTRTSSIPIFMGEEVTVKKAVEGIRGVEMATEGVKAAPVVKAAPAPATQAAPLPIVPPSVTVRVLPAYPASSLANGTEGVVLLSAYVGLTGQPEKIETKTSSGISELDEAAMKAVSQWQFSPASQGGAALASWFEVPVRFVIK